MRRLLGLRERQLRSWEQQGLLETRTDYAFSDLIALRTLQQLRRNHVPAQRIRRALEALRAKLGAATDPLTEFRIYAEGGQIAVEVEGQKMEAVSGQLLLDFDQAELHKLLAFPESREPEEKRKKRESQQWFEKGLELESGGAEMEKAMEAYQTAVELDPSSAGALVNLGTLHFHRREWTMAEECYRKAVAADPEYALAHFNLGNLYDELANRGHAMFHYLTALRLDPNYADAHYNLALLYQAEGEVMRAVRHWKVYLKLDPGSEWAANARRELDRLRAAAIVR
jgi:tetratricopeptide (TPR) repeat protein